MPDLNHQQSAHEVPGGLRQSLETHPIGLIHLLQAYLPDPLGLKPRAHLL